MRGPPAVPRDPAPVQPGAAPPPPFPGLESLRLLGALIGWALIYWGIGLLGWMLGERQLTLVTLHPAVGVALAAVVLRGRQMLPAVFVAASVEAAAERAYTAPLDGVDVAVALAAGLGITLQAALGAWLLRDRIRRPAQPVPERSLLTTLSGHVPVILNDDRKILVFLGLAGPAIGWIGPMAEMLARWALGDLPLSPSQHLLSGALSNALGSVLVTPILLSLLNPKRRARQRRTWQVALPSALTLITVAVLLHDAQRAEERRSRAALAHDTGRVSEALDDQLVTSDRIVSGLAGFIEGGGAGSLQSFQRFAGQLREQQPALHLLSWNAVVTDAERDGFVAHARLDYPDFALHELEPDGTLRPAGPGTVVVVRLIATEDDYTNVPGLVVSSEARRAQALGVAMFTGRAAATEPVTLVQPNPEPHGILIFVRVMRTGPAGPEVAGFATATLRVKALLEAAAGAVEAGMPALDVKLLDVSTPSAPILLAALPSFTEGPLTQARVSPPVEPGTYTFAFAGRTWRLEATPTAAWMAAHGPQPLLGLQLGSLLFSSLVCAFLLVRAGHEGREQERSEQLARVNEELKNESEKYLQTKRRLEEEIERANVTLHSIGDGVITTDSHGRVRYLNPMAENMTGWSNGEAQGKPLWSILHLVSEHSGEQVEDPIQLCLRTRERFVREEPTVLVNRHGRRLGVEEVASPMRSPTDALLIGGVLVLRDVTEPRRLTAEARHHASHDALTGLVNRRELEQRLQRAVSGARQHNHRHALCYLDLDQFKIVNDTAGHAVGDELLKQVTALLQGEVRDRDTLARLGGDEFGLLLEHCPLPKACEIAELMVEAVRNFRFVWENRVFQIGVSAGLVAIDANARSAAELLGQADVACYAAKDAGRSRVHVYRAEEAGRDVRHAQIHRAADLRSALEERRFHLFYQAIHPLNPQLSGQCHYELLLRMTDHEGQLVPPGAFIPAAERYGIMGVIDRWVIGTALPLCASLVERDPLACFGINLSGNTLNDSSLVGFVKDQLHRSGMPAAHLCFEITETAAIHNLSLAEDFIKELRREGCRFALDDFGSGLSSFAYLKRLPVDYLKIDGGFVRDLLTDPSDRAMVSAINDVGHTMGLKTIAEYVESEEVATALRDIGVDFGQGYGLHRPALFVDPRVGGLPTLVRPGRAPSV